MRKSPLSLLLLLSFCLFVHVCTSDTHHTRPQTSRAKPQERTPPDRSRCAKGAGAHRKPKGSLVKGRVPPLPPDPPSTIARTARNSSARRTDGTHPYAGGAKCDLSDAQEFESRPCRSAVAFAPQSGPSRSRSRRSRATCADDASLRRAHSHKIPLYISLIITFERQALSTVTDLKSKREPSFLAPL